MRLIKYNVQQLVVTKTGFNRVIYLERVSFCLRNEAAGDTVSSLGVFESCGGSVRLFRVLLCFTAQSGWELINSFPLPECSPKDYVDCELAWQK